MTNVVDTLLNSARVEKDASDDMFLRRRPSGEHLAKAEGLEYAAGFVNSRINQLKSELARVRFEASREPLDCQERDEQLYRDGQVAGLIAALSILGVEVQDDDA